MKYIIPYKTKTKNLNAGRCDYQAPGRQIHYLKYNKELPEKYNFKLILKKQFCKDNNIDLLEISYKDRKNIEHILKEKLNINE